MTGCAVGWCTCKSVVGVALTTSDANVSSRQSKPGSSAMVKLRSSPLRSRVASLTRPGKTGRNMARACGPVKGRQMARNAVLRRAREPVIHVTL